MENLATARILVAEDREMQRLGIKRDIEAIEKQQLNKSGIKLFHIDLAETVEEAQEYFRNSSKMDYDLLILDLGLPKRKGGIDKPEYGLELLMFALNNNLVKEVIVITVWNEIEYVLKVFKLGAFDFIDKSNFTSEEFQWRVLDCWKRILSNQSRELLGATRVFDLAPCAEKGLVSMFTKLFSNLANDVVNNADSLKKYMQERYGLEEQKDVEDPFFQLLHEQKSHLDTLTKEWEKMQNSLQSSNKPYQSKNINSLLNDIHQNLLPCLVVKNLELELADESSLNIKSLENDVSAVFREIIVGALGLLPDNNATKESITIKLENIKGQVIVKFEDNLEPISGQDAKTINRGSIISPQRRFGREWGLSVVQHIAIRGGGRLEIEPLSQGNIVNYYIPLA